MNLENNNWSKRMYNVVILFIGTGKYINFFNKFYNNCEEYLFPNSSKTYFCFTDAEFGEDTPNNIKVIPTQQEDWPYPTLKRFHNILREKENYHNFDYIIYLDADMLVNETILENEFQFDSDYTGVHHPGFYLKNQPMPYERRKISQACIDDIGTVYWQGCLWGGKPKSVIELCEVLSKRVDIDLSKNLIAEWHDESHINKFFLENKERVFTLGPEYAFPEVYDVDVNKNFNYPNINPKKRKIIHLLKNHSEIRE